MRDCPIAIVGLGGVFPGANDVEAFWSNIANGRTFSRPAPAGRWVVDAARVSRGYGPDSVASEYGCFVDDEFALDAAGLGLSLDVSLLNQLDPVYSMAVHAGAQAFRDARMGRVDRDRVGVILAAIALPTAGASAMTREVLGERFRRRVFERFRAVSGVDSFERRVHGLNAQATALPGALVAESLGLGGGSYTLDAACASSLYALKLACNALRLGRCDAMIAGGVSRPDCLYTQMGFTQLRALSPSGVCAPFDASSDGLVVGEGAGAVVLKRLDDARRDGDAIHGVIRGIGLSNDIGGSLLAPDSEGQLRAMRAAYAAAGWRPRDVELVECHGTGTPLGDAVEVRSLRSLWDGDDAGDRKCAIGSIKSMIGHLLTGAGAAGLIKTLMAMRHGQIPPSANYSDCGDVIPLKGSAFYVPTAAGAWSPRAALGIRRAAVSAFGFGGINAHVLIESAADSESRGVSVGGAALPDAQAEYRIGCGGHGPPYGIDLASLEPVAIVGMDARFGSAEGLDAFRDVVFAGASALSERSAERWRGAEEMLGDASGGLDVGAYLDRIDVATGEFKIPPNEIAEILPQQLVMLKSVAAAMRDASLTATEARPRWGVIVGMALDPETTNFHLRWWLRQAAPEWATQLGLRLTAEAMASWTDRLIASIQVPLNAPGVVGNLGGMIASRIAREFRFGGASFGVSSEEASGLWALEIGARSLQLGETDVSVVGAVDLAGDWRLALARGADLEGAAVGEGAATVVLKRLSDAERDGDRVYAIVRGVGAATSGGFLTGSRRERSIELAMRRAMGASEIAPASIGYVECAAVLNGVCASAELNAMRDAYGDCRVHNHADHRDPIPEGMGHPSEVGHLERDGVRDAIGPHSGPYGDGEPPGPRQRLTLGCAAGDVGCCGAAAGMASLVRAALVVHERMLPEASLMAASLAEDSSARDALAAIGANVPVAPMYWHQDRADGPRRAGVTAVSSDGNAAHVVLEECAVARESSRDDVGSPIGLARPLVFACSGDDAAALTVKLESLRAMVSKSRDDGRSIEDMYGESLDAGLHVATDSLCVALTAESIEKVVTRVASAVEHLRARPDVRLEGRDGVWYSPGPMGMADAAETNMPTLGGGMASHAALGEERPVAPGNIPVERGGGSEADHRDPIPEGMGHPALGGKHPVAHETVRTADPTGMVGTAHPAKNMAFVFPGSGNHFIGMGREIAARWPHVARAMDEEFAHLASHSMVEWFAPYRFDWRKGWERDAAARACEDMRRVIFAQVAYGVLMHDVLRDMGLIPGSVIGYSLGESTSLFATRAWPDADEMWRRMSSSTLFKSDLYAERYALKRAWQLTDAQAASWRTVIFAKPADLVRAALEGVGHARLMIVNAPKECVVGGLPDALAIVGERLRCRAVPVESVPTVHFDAVRDVEDAYRALHVMETRPDAALQYYSCHLGRSYDVTQAAAAESITAQALFGFDFAKVIESAYADGVRVFIEVGPQASCTRMIRRILGDRPHFAMSAGAQPGESESAAGMRLAAACLAERIPVKLKNSKIEKSQNDGTGRDPAGRRVVSVPVGGVAAEPVGIEAFVELRRPAGLDRVGAHCGFDHRDPIPEGVGYPAGISHQRTEGGCRGDGPHSGPYDAGLDGVIDHRDPIPEGVGHPAGGDSRGGGYEKGLSYQQDQRDSSLKMVSVDDMPDEMRAMMEAGSATASAHAAFMRFAEAGREGLQRATQLQMELVEAAMRRGALPTLTATAKNGEGNVVGTAHPTVPIIETPPLKGWATPAPGTPAPSLLTEQWHPMFPREMCMEFAVGKLGNVLGPDFAIVDSYPVRVRLPAEPLMLVDRILTVEAEMASLSHGRVVTEHDVLPGAWYLDGGVAPVCITVEAGQADLFLCSYLGIDLAVKGTRSYRLLDATVEFHSALPRPGETIHYDIHIDRFVKQGETYLFFFRFDGTIDGRLVLTMRSGCAGFFTDAEIANSGGIILTAEDVKPIAGTRDPSWRPLVPFDRVESYSDAQVAALRSGDLEGCFGEMFAGLGIADPLRLPTGRMQLFDRVLELDPNGGRFGLGRIRAEADIHPDDWFLTCHFIDDMTMPGTLMYECCVHALRFFLLRMGWVGEQGGVSYQPLHGIPSALKCRGPVTQSTQKVHYEVDIKEIGYGPEPYVIADALMLGDGRKIVQMLDMSLSLRGLSREAIEGIWKFKNSKIQKSQNRGVGRAHQDGEDFRAASGGYGPPYGDGPHSGPYEDGKFKNSKIQKSQNRGVGRAHQYGPHSGPYGAHGTRHDGVRAVDHRDPTPEGVGPPPSGTRAKYDKSSILAYSNGRPSEAFGAPYTVFDSERVIARLPGPPFQFMDRVVEVSDEPFVLKPTDWIVSEYDVPADAWYFSANRQPTMPFAVLLEAALQPCGWLAAYCGSALRSKTDVSFRNLGGTATLRREVHPGTGMLTVRVRMTNVNEAGGMIIQEYDMQVFDAQGCVYEGTTSFGFFSKAALAQQLGIRDAKGRRFVPVGAALAEAKAFAFEKLAPWTPDDGAEAVAFEGLVQPARAFLMLDRVDALSLTGGPDGLGFVRGSTPVDPGAWFFKAHFYQDPVWPGSLGLESFQQLLKAYAIERWGDLAATHRFEAIATGIEHSWAYRGQILPTNKHVEVEAVVTRVEDGDEPLVVASGFLTVDGTTIYEMKLFGLRLVRAV